MPISEHSLPSQFMLQSWVSWNGTVHFCCYSGQITNWPLLWPSHHKEMTAGLRFSLGTFLAVQWCKHSKKKKNFVDFPFPALFIVTALLRYCFLVSFWETLRKLTSIRLCKHRRQSTYQTIYMATVTVQIPQKSYHKSSCHAASLFFVRAYRQTLSNPARKSQEIIMHLCYSVWLKITASGQ